MKIGLFNARAGTGVIIPAVFVFIAVTNLPHVRTLDPPSTAAVALPGFARSADPRIIDGDTVAFGELHVRILGIDAPDTPLWMKELAASRLEDLSHDFGGLRCASTTGVPKRSYDRVVMQCVFQSNEADVGGSMVSQGFAVDWPRYSGGKYGSFMDRAIASRRGLWHENPAEMAALADRRQSPAK